jgi:hypothetical protein
VQPMLTVVGLAGKSPVTAPFSFAVAIGFFSLPFFFFFCLWFKKKK